VSPSADSFATGRFLSPPAVARRLAVKPERVIGWIRRGELRALNVGDGKQRPRYRVSEADLLAFEQRRAVVPPAKPSRRRRQSAEVIQFF